MVDELRFVDLLLRLADKYVLIPLKNAYELKYENHDFKPGK